MLMGSFLGKGKKNAHLRLIIVFLAFCLVSSWMWFLLAGGYSRYYTEPCTVSEDSLDKEYKVKEDLLDGLKYQVSLDRNVTRLLDKATRSLRRNINDDDDDDNKVIKDSTTLNDLSTTTRMKIGKEEISKKTFELQAKITTVVLVICYNRHQYLDRMLKSLVRVYPKPGSNLHDALRPKLVISQDGGGQSNMQIPPIAQKYLADPLFQGNGEYWSHQRGVDERRPMEAYFKLAQHYGWALGKAFEDSSIERVIVLEDDLDLAVDFFDFMAGVKSMVDYDTKIIAASAWNDHGQAKFVDGASPSSLVLSDFFGGLGWMMPRRMWTELGPIWPDSFWDDWMRDPRRRKDRYTIRPEISRTVTFGESGASQGQFYKSFLSPMVLNTNKVDFMSMELSVKGLSSSFMAEFEKAKQISSRPTSEQDLAQQVKGGQAFKIPYGDFQDYVRLTNSLGLMNDVKFDIPRGAFKGIVPLYFKGVRVFLYKMLQS